MICKLVEIIITQIWFLDQCDDEVLDPDTAVKRMEDIAYDLGQLTPTERAEFVICLEKLATEAEDKQASAYSHDATYVQFLRDFAADMGIGDEDDTMPEGH